MPPSVPAPPAPPKHMTVYLVNRPAAAQSVLSVGQVGVPLHHARLLRPAGHERPWVDSSPAGSISTSGRTRAIPTAPIEFRFSPGPRPFQAGGSVQTAVTKEALARAGQGDQGDHRLRRSPTRARLCQGPADQGLPVPVRNHLRPRRSAFRTGHLHLPDDYFTTTSRRSRESPRTTSSGPPGSTSTPST